MFNGSINVKFTMFNEISMGILVCSSGVPGGDGDGGAVIDDCPRAPVQQQPVKILVNINPNQLQQQSSPAGGVGKVEVGASLEEMSSLAFTNIAR